MCLIRSKHLKWPACRFSPYPAACAFPAPLEPAGAIVWQQNAIISQLSHRRLHSFPTDVTAANKQQTAGRAITTPSRNETTAAELIDGEITLSKVHLK